MAATQYLYMQQGQPIAQRASSISRAYQYDGMGSVRRMVRNNGNISDTFRFDMFGEVVSRTGTTKTPFSWNVGAGMQSGPNGLYVQQTIGYVAPLTTGSPKFGAGGSIWNDQGGSSFGPPPALPRAWISGGIVWVQLGDGPPIKIDLGWLWDVIGPPIYVIERPWTGAIGPPVWQPPPTVVPPPGSGTPPPVTPPPGGRVGPPIGGATGDTPGALGGPHPDFICPVCPPCTDLLLGSGIDPKSDIIDGFANCILDDDPLDCIGGIPGDMVIGALLDYLACIAVNERYDLGASTGTCNPCAKPEVTKTGAECCDMKNLSCLMGCADGNVFQVIFCLASCYFKNLQCLSGVGDTDA